MLLIQQPAPARQFDAPRGFGVLSVMKGWQLSQRMLVLTFQGLNQRHGGFMSGLNVYLSVQSTTDFSLREDDVGVNDFLKHNSFWLIVC